MTMSEGELGLDFRDSTNLSVEVVDRLELKLRVRTVFVFLVVFDFLW